jgi:hypothetical protein
MAAKINTLGNTARKAKSLRATLLAGSHHETKTRVKTCFIRTCLDHWTRASANQTADSGPFYNPTTLRHQTPQTFPKATARAQVFRY